MCLILRDVVMSLLSGQVDDGCVACSLAATCLRRATCVCCIFYCEVRSWPGWCAQTNLSCCRTRGARSLLSGADKRFFEVAPGGVSGCGGLAGHPYS